MNRGGSVGIDAPAHQLPRGRPAYGRAVVQHAAVFVRGQFVAVHPTRASLADLEPKPLPPKGISVPTIPTMIARLFDDDSDADARRVHREIDAIRTRFEGQPRRPSRRARARRH